MKDFSVSRAIKDLTNNKIMSDGCVAICKSIQ